MAELNCNILISKKDWQTGRKMFIPITIPGYTGSDSEIGPKLNFVGFQNEVSMYIRLQMYMESQFTMAKIRLYVFGFPNYFGQYQCDCYQNILINNKNET